MKIFLLNLGCAKNQVDSEDLAGMLVSAGHEIVGDVSSAETAIVNTCGFILPAVEESIDAILDLEKMKQEGRLKSIGVVGCLVKRYGVELMKELPVIDFWAGPQEWHRVMEYLGSPLTEWQRGFLPETRFWTRYLKISEGCNSRCSYCTIPSIRGPLKSLPLSQILRDTEVLLEQGAREICLVSQDPTMYGVDISGRPMFNELLKSLEGFMPRNVWLRLLYLNPSRIDEELLHIVNESPVILSYLDMPIQHVNPVILSSMNRQGNSDMYKKTIDLARSLDPLFAIRTTLIVGYPGETEEQFSELLDFLGEMELDRVGAFTFYPEEGTPAASLEGQVPQEIKDHRYRRLMEFQADISLSRQKKLEGQCISVILEEIGSKEDLSWGRSYRDAPEVDGMVGISGADEFSEGDLIRVRVTEATEHDLFAEVL